MRAIWPVVSALMVLSATSCTKPESVSRVTSAEQACDRAKAAVAARGDYQASQIVACDGGLSTNDAGYYVLRLNGACHEEVCGSVLLGWYGVKQSTGEVYEWDIGDSRPINQVVPGA